MTNAVANTKKQEVILVTVMLVILVATIAIVVWQTEKINAGCKHETKQTRSNHIIGVRMVKNLTLHKNMKVQILKDDKPLFEGVLGWNIVNMTSTQIFKQCSDGNGTAICLEQPGEFKLMVDYSASQISQNGTMIELGCYDIEWQALRCVDQVFTDCYNITSAQWFGGYADKIQNWPFQRNVRNMSAYMVNDSYIGEIGGVVERYFFSSAGIGIAIDHDVPLYFNLNHPNEGLMCFTAKYDNYPYFSNRQKLHSLKYKICQGENVLDIHRKMSSVFLEKPSGIPDEKLFRYPIWSTWAQYHKDVNQSTVMAFASNILKHNFTHAQLEIDDDWTPTYGDLEFNKQKFPNATEMIRDLNEIGFRVTVWIHPFFNIDSKAFEYAAKNFMLVRQFESPVPAMTPWWDGKLAGILDVSNSSAVGWFIQKLKNLQTTYNISSFKFDAGETSWLPHVYSNADPSHNPAEMYPMKWVDLAAKADNTYHQEVRVGYRTQKYPIFVRMMDKMSNWGHDNAFKTVIPCVLTYGLLGYPFVLPDMIGGNAYDNQPEPELYIRWLQMNTFLPSMQFSIVPWMYNDTTIRIVQKYTKLHEQYSDTLIKYANIAMETGAPIIRPLWWLSPSDDVALKCEDEFLVGDDLLVAPVMEPGARSRDVYFPVGRWRDQFRNKSDIITGPKWRHNIPVALDELAFYTREPI